METPDFTPLDQEILKSITKYPGGMFTHIHAGRVSVEANKIDSMRADRVTYRRMQELEKQNLIRQEKKCWYPA